MRLPQVATPRPRQQIGFILNFCTSDDGGKHFQFAGTLAVKQTDQKIGSENEREYILSEDLEIQRSFSKKRALKKGTLVRVMVHPLEGREM